MAQPLLPDLLIEGYRGLRRLELKKLGHVNLIVGQNGVGKTSVLEAVRLYSTLGSAECLADLLRLRREVETSSDPVPQFEVSAVASLFPGNPQRSSPLLRIGSRARQMEFSIVWVPFVLDSLGNRVLYFDAAQPRGYAAESEAAMLVEEAGVVRRLFTLKRLPVTGHGGNSRVAAAIEHPSVFVTSQGIDFDNFGAYWDHVVDNLQEELVLETLRSVWPDVEQIRMFGSEQRPKVKIKGGEGFVPLSRLGEGILRFLGIAIGLVRARDGVLLIDEFENGLHYRTQELLWRYVIRMARELRVQVFATTHSQDCINSFGQAATADTESDGVLFRLERFRGEIVETHFDESSITRIAENLIEVR